MDNHIRFADNNGVCLTVVDGEDELHKMARLGSKMSVLIRLATDDKDSVCRFSKKFGCIPENAPKLLALAKKLGVDVKGISFHVGSGCGDAQAYVTALRDARTVFDAAIAMGMPSLKIVDIGGGFPGSDEFAHARNLPTFVELANTIKDGMQMFFANTDVKFIAEPGRFMVSACGYLATLVYGRKGGNSDQQALYIDDGVYGSFNHVIYDHAVPRPALFKEITSNSPKLPTQIFGPTCDGLDQICEENDTAIPHVEVGDWLFWDDMGAYTHCASFVFNGYDNIPTKTYVHTIQE